jgi:superfamily II DNA or RNA helicase
MSRNNAVIDKRGFTFKPNASEVKKIATELRFKAESVASFGPPKRSFTTYTWNSDGTVTVPRAWGLKNVMGCDIKVCFEQSADLRDECRLKEGFELDSSRCQDAAADAVYQCLMVPLNRGGGLGIISLPCGGGKTVLFIYILLHLIRKRAAIIVHTNQLADQWEERLRFFCPGIRVGRVQGAVNTSCGSDVMICMLQTLTMRADLDPGLLEGVAVVGVDECHLVCTETFSKLLTRWGAPYIFGLSATPNRKDKLENVLLSHLGGVIYSGTREKVAVEVEFVHPDVTSHKEIMNPRSKKPDHVAMITALVDDPQRTSMIASCALKYKESKVLVLSERRGHLESIMGRIIEMDPAMVNSVGLYRGQMKPHELKESEQKSVILGTYSIASVGLDIRGLNTLVLATPRSDVVQACGRIQRDLSPIFPKRIVDVHDKFSIFNGQYAKRLSYYRQAEFHVSRVRTQVISEVVSEGAQTTLLAFDPTLQ